MRPFLTLLLGLFLLAAGGAAAQSTLEAARARGAVLCGVSGALPGFSAPDSGGVMRGLDAEFCRAVAAAALGDAARVRFVELATPAAALAALEAGQVDLVARNLTLTLLRDAGRGIEPVAVLFHDGQGFLVRSAGGIAHAEDLAGRSICVAGGGATSAPVLRAFLARQSIAATVREFETQALAVAAFRDGGCEAVSADTSALAARRVTEFPDPALVTLLPLVISREPLGPFVRSGDPTWRAILFWVRQALIEAEEFGIASTTLVAALQSPDPLVRRLLGLEPGIGTALGLPDDWVVQVVRQVGNYGEMFDRTLGRGSVIGLDRGLNDLWLRGGLIYPLPLR
jgi:general L-amino acid transport system substrate-binding protein